MSNYTDLVNWRRRNKEKVKASRIVFVGLRNKSLTRSPCYCGKSKVEAHHEDYSKPLEIIWLCKKHHIEADKKRREKEPIVEQEKLMHMSTEEAWKYLLRDVV